MCIIKMLIKTKIKIIWLCWKSGSLLHACDRYLCTCECAVLLLWPWVWALTMCRCAVYSTQVMCTFSVLRAWTDCLGDLASLVDGCLMSSRCMWVPQDPVGSNNRHNQYDTLSYKPEDDSSGLKHVALLIVAWQNFAPHCCVRRKINNKLKC